ncbi:hypothetical protein JCM11491_002634 [Sporobolomyces phaffii]
MDRLASLPHELLQLVFDLALRSNETPFGPLSRRLLPFQLRALYANFRPRVPTDLHRFASTVFFEPNRAACVKSLVFTSIDSLDGDAVITSLASLLPQLSGLDNLELPGSSRSSICFWIQVSRYPGAFTNLRRLKCSIISEEEKGEAGGYKNPLPRDRRGLHLLRHLPRLTELRTWWDTDLVVSPLEPDSLRSIRTLAFEGPGAGQVNTSVLIAACPALVQIEFTPSQYINLSDLFPLLPDFLKALRIGANAYAPAMALLAPRFLNLADLSLDADELELDWGDFLAKLSALQSFELKCSSVALDVAEGLVESALELSSLRSIKVEFGFSSHSGERVDLTKDWITYYQRGDTSRRLDLLDYTCSDIWPMLELLEEEAKGRGIKVEHNLSEAWDEGRRQAIEVNNRLIVRAVALGTAVELDLAYYIAEDFDFELPEYDEEQLSTRLFVVVKEEVEALKCFLLADRKK